MSDAPQSPLADTDPDSITALFDRDPTLLEKVDLDRLISEMRRRADRYKAEAAADAAKPKQAKSRGSRGQLVDAAMAAVADKPIEELSLDDLLGDGQV